MAGHRKGRAISGWVALDKATGITSARAVSRVRHIFNAQKAGHAGTLDPLATGVLPIALGEATKTVPYVMDGSKVYRFTVAFGEARDTDDLEGRVTETSEVRPENTAIQSKILAFTGKVVQNPPVYSSVKVDGERSYRRARAGTGILPAARAVQIERFELLSRPDPEHAVFEVECGKGTYIRSLARDLGSSLKTVAHVSELRRTQCGPFSERNTISLDNLSETMLCAPPHDCLLPVAAALDDIPALTMTETQTDRLCHGLAVRARSGNTVFVNANVLEEIADGGVLCAMAGNTPVALARLDGEEIRPIRVFNLKRVSGRDTETE